MSNFLAQIIETEEQVRNLMRSVCDFGDYQSCHLAEQIWKLVDQLRILETSHIVQNETIESE